MAKREISEDLARTLKETPVELIVRYYGIDELMPEMDIQDVLTWIGDDYTKEFLIGLGYDVD